MFMDYEYIANCTNKLHWGIEKELKSLFKIKKIIIGSKLHWIMTYLYLFIKKIYSLYRPFTFIHAIYFPTKLNGLLSRVSSWGRCSGLCSCR